MFLDKTILLHPGSCISSAKERREWSWHMWWLFFYLPPSLFENRTWVGSGPEFVNSIKSWNSSQPHNNNIRSAPRNRLYDGLCEPAVSRAEWRSSAQSQSNIELIRSRLFERQEINNWYLVTSSTNKDWIPSAGGLKKNAISPRCKIIVRTYEKSK